MQHLQVHIGSLFLISKTVDHGDIAMSPLKPLKN